jgi:hypothetical protein
MKIGSQENKSSEMIFNFSKFFSQIFSKNLKVFLRIESFSFQHPMKIIYILSNIQ